MNKKLFILDLDGTTLMNYWEFHPNLIKDIKVAQKKGHIICIITGRPYSGCYHLHSKLKLNTCLVTLNGNKIFKINKKRPNVISSTSFSTIFLTKYIAELKKKNVVIDFAFNVEEKVFSTREYEDILDYWYHDRKWKIISINNLEIVPKWINSAILIIPKKFSKNFKKFIFKNQDLYVHKWEEEFKGNDIYEIFSSLKNKGTATKFVANRYKINLKNVIVFGDGRNDIPMFKVAKTSYAMKNACEELKNIASEVLPHTNKENGVGIKIREIINT